MSSVVKLTAVDKGERTESVTESMLPQVCRNKPETSRKCTLARLTSQSFLLGLKSEDATSVPEENVRVFELLRMCSGVFLVGSAHISKLSCYIMLHHVTML